MAKISIHREAGEDKVSVTLTNSDGMTSGFDCPIDLFRTFTGSCQQALRQIDRAEALRSTPAAEQMTPDVDERGRCNLCGFSPAQCEQPNCPAAEQGADEGWRPIETAPRDGTKVDLWRVDGCRETDCYWTQNDQCDWRWCDGELLWPDAQFSHWRPSPAPPEPRHD